jgi:hypothetical protein
MTIDPASKVAIAILAIAAVAFIGSIFEPTREERCMSKAQRLSDVTKVREKECAKLGMAPVVEFTIVCGDVAVIEVTGCSKEEGI